MNDEQARRVHVNDCVRDSEIEEAERLLAEADAGEWRVSYGQVLRYGDKPMEKVAGSLRLMAASVRLIPRLIRGLRVLEEKLTLAWIENASMRREMLDERARHAEDMARAFKGETGPESDIDVLAEAIQLGAYTVERGSTWSPKNARDALARILRVWATGSEIQKVPNLRIDLEGVRRRKLEEDRIRASIEEDHVRARAEVQALLVELRLKKKEREVIAAKIVASRKSKAPEGLSLDVAPREETQ